MDGELIETAAPSAATTTRVEPPSPQLLEAWGPLSTLAGRYWVLVDQGAAQHLRYEWEEAGAALTFSGLDRDGNVLAGRFMIDPATREMAGLSIFRGEAYEQNVVIEGTAFTVTTTSGPEQTRARYVRAGIGGFRVEREVFRGNRWRPTRTQSLNVASASIVEALDWRARSAEREAAEARAREELFERRPGFFSRLQTAVQDGLTAGVEEGVRERTRSAITGDESGAEYEAVPLEEDQETDLDKE